LRKTGIGRRAGRKRASGGFCGSRTTRVTRVLGRVVDFKPLQQHKGWVQQPTSAQDVPRSQEGHAGSLTTLATRCAPSSTSCHSPQGTRRRKAGSIALKLAAPSAHSQCNVSGVCVLGCALSAPACTAEPAWLAEADGRRDRARSAPMCMLEHKSAPACLRLPHYTPSACRSAALPPPLPPPRRAGQPRRAARPARAMCSADGEAQSSRDAAQPGHDAAQPGGVAGAAAGSGRLPAQLLGGVPGFSDAGAERFSVAVIGDLHLEPAQMGGFHVAREQLREAVGAADERGRAPAARVVQLGDLGGYEHAPGAARRGGAAPPACEATSVLGGAWSAWRTCARAPAACSAPRQQRLRYCQGPTRLPPLLVGSLACAAACTAAPGHAGPCLPSPRRSDGHRACARLAGALQSSGTGSSTRPSVLWPPAPRERSARARRLASVLPRRGRLPRRLRRRAARAGRGQPRPGGRRVRDRRCQLGGMGAGARPHARVRAAPCACTA